MTFMTCFALITDTDSVTDKDKTHSHTQKAQLPYPCTYMYSVILESHTHTHVTRPYHTHSAYFRMAYFPAGRLIFSVCAPT